MNLVELAPDIFKESVDTGILTLSFPDYPFRLLIELAVGNVDGDFLLRRHFDKVFQITAKLRSAEGGDRTGADALLRIGMTRSSSIPATLPNPSHVPQAPNGLLKENICGIGSRNSIPSLSKRSL